MFKMLALAMVLSLCAPAQSPTDVFDKAPPQVDASLRARVTKFLQAHVDGKFRRAEEVVHEDSKDAFYNSEKQKYKGFEIVKIVYSDNFQKAEVVTSIDVDWYTPRTGKMPIKVPQKSLWKYDGGEWWWYLSTKREWETPFGTMHPGAETSGGERPNIVIPDAESILSKVKVSKNEIMLSSWQKSQDYAEIVNNMPGDLTLELERYVAPGLTVTIDKPVVHAGETARILFDYNPPDSSVKVTRDIQVKASPTGKSYAFTVRFAVPPGYEKFMPKKQ